MERPEGFYWRKRENAGQVWRAFRRWRAYFSYQKAPDFWEGLWLWKYWYRWQGEIRCHLRLHPGQWLFLRELHRDPGQNLQVRWEAWKLVSWHLVPEDNKDLPGSKDIVQGGFLLRRSILYWSTGSAGWGKGKASESPGRRAWRCLHVDRKCGDFCSFSGKHHNHLPAFLSYAPEKEAVMSVFYLNLS